MITQTESVQGMKSVCKYKNFLLEVVSNRPR